MTSTEKSELFRVLTTAEGWISGYRIDIPEPTFTDSIETPSIDAETAVPAFETIEAVEKEVLACHACRLGDTRIHAVPGEGPRDMNAIRVMVIGEGPGADEDSSGRPFVGKAGQLLDKMLSAISLSRTTNCYIANIVKCRPPQNREPAPDESGTCMPFLMAQISLIQPTMILALGRTAAQNLLGTSDGINKLRGRIFDFQGIPLLPTFHPSALLRDETLKRPAWEDLKTFRTELDRISGAVD